MIDGYHLPWGKILLVYYEYIIKKVLWFSVTSSENKDAIVYTLRILRDSFSYKIRAFVIDGSPSILSAIKSVYPNSIVQCCLVHIQRQVMNYISNHPKSEAGIRLLHILNYPPLSNLLLFQTPYSSQKCLGSGERSTFHISLKNPSPEKDDGFLLIQVSVRQRSISTMLCRICFKVINTLTVTSKDRQPNWNDISEFLLTNESMSTNDYQNTDYILS